MRDIVRPILIALALCALVALSGCRVAVFSDSRGKMVFVGSALTDPHFNKVEIKPDAITLDGYGSQVNTKATAAVVEGAVRAFIRP